MSDLPVAITGVEFKKTGAVFTSDDFKSWASIGGQLRQITECAGWWWGDWLVYGDRWSMVDGYEEAIAASGLSYQTLRNLKSLAISITLSRRRDKLTVAHHAEILGLDLDAQEQLLDKAVDEKWTVKQLRDAASAKKDGVELADAGRSGWNAADWALNIAKRFENGLIKHPPADWAESTRRNVKRTLEPLVKLYNEL